MKSKLLLFFLSCLSVGSIFAQCNYSLEMNDSWGDGWNGGSMDLLVNGTVVLDGVSASLFQTVTPFSVNTGDDITTDWQADGSFPGEISWRILDSEGLSVASGGAGAGDNVGTGTLTASCPSCSAPTALTVSGITTSSADLGWTAGDSETVWDIEWGGDGFTQGSGTMINNTSDNPYSLSGLTANTAYEFYVRADCGGADGESSWAGPFGFTTECEVFTPGYSVDFSTFLPSCWEEAGAGDAASGPSDLGSGLWSQSGTLARINLYTTNREDWLLTPGFDLSSGSWEIVLEISAVDFGSSTSFSGMGSDDLVEVLASSDNGSSWTVIKTYNQSNPMTVNSTDDVINIDSYTGSNVLFAIRAADGPTGDSEDYYVNIHSFEIRTPPSCAAPTALSASSITATTASLGWTAGDSETVWDVEWGLSGFAQGSGTMINDTSDNPYTLSGLSSGTSYDFYVRANCGGSDSSWVGPFSFSTDIACGDTVTGLCYSQTNTIEVLANFTATPGDWAELVFNSGNTEDTYDEILVYDGLDGTGNLIFGSLSGGVYDTAGLDPVVSTTGQISLAINSDSGITCSSSASIDPISITLNCVTPPSCLEPTSLTASNFTSSSADLGWTAGDSETLWDIEWGIDGFTQGSGTSIDNTTDNPYTLTGLMPETAYEFYVRADCGGSESSWAGPFDFTTPCEVVTPVYDVDFSTFLPDCWEEAGDGDASTGPSGLGGGAWSQSGTLARVNLFSSGKSEWLLTPEFDLSGGPWQMLLEISGSDFSGGGFSGMGSDDSVEVLVSTDQGSSWSVIYTFNASSPIPSSATDVSIDLSSYTSASNLFGIRASEGTSNDAEDYYVNVHSFEINTPPSCPAPTMLVVTNIAASSADLGWTAGDAETMWDIEWGVDGFTQGSGTMINDTSDNPYTLSGLTANTAYEFYVRADCGGGDESTWAGPFDFTTSPNAIALPINESFESGLTVFDNAPGNSTDWVVNTSYFKVGSQSLSNAHGSSNTNTLLQTSVFDLSSTPDAVLQFWHIAKLEGGFDKGFVEVSTDGGATYSPLPASAYLGHSDDYDTEGYFHEDSYEIWGASNTSPDNATWWKRETFDLSAYSSSTMRIRFRLTSDTSVNRAGWFIDDITVKEAYVYAAGSWNTSPVGLSNSTSTVIIEDGTAMPSGAFTTGDLLILPGATLNNNNGSVSVTSFMDNSGQVRGGNRLIMSGTSSSEIVGDGLISNLEINNSNGVVLNGDQGMIGRLFLQSGVLTTNDRLTFTSNTSTTAVVAAHNPVASSISGNVTVERFIPGSNRAYRFLTSSVSGQSVFDAWQESGNNANGFGTQITGTTGTTGTVNSTTGHDETISGNPSMFTYDASTNNWSPVSDTRAETLNAGTFYRLLVRGNRTNDLSTNTGTVTDVTLRSNGTLTEGTVTFNGTGTGNYLGIGNPYQSQVDMNATIRNSIAADMYYYDPTLGTQGAYTYVEIATGANTNGTSSNAANILHPGQAVFVLESGASASVQFDENDKTTTFVSNIGIFSNPTNAAYLNLRLLGVPSGASTPNNLDGLMMKFDATENLALDFDDARKWQNLDENLAIDKGNNELLAIERRPQPIADEIVNLSLTQYRNTDYQFEVTLDLLPGLKAYIKDNLNNTMTEIIQGGASTTTTYSFTVDPNNPQSVATDRFQLVFETVTLGVGQDNAGSISIYPNPVTADELTIALGSTYSGQDVQVSIYNSVGQLIRTASENTGSSSMITLSGMDDMANGIYFVSLKGENLEHTEKIVIK